MSPLDAGSPKGITNAETIKMGQQLYEALMGQDPWVPSSEYRRANCDQLAIPGYTVRKEWNEADIRYDGSPLPDKSMMIVENKEGGHTYILYSNGRITVFEPSTVGRDSRENEIDSELVRQILQRILRASEVAARIQKELSETRKRLFEAAVIDLA